MAPLVTYSYNAIFHRVLLADDAALAEIGEALQMAERSAEDIALVLIRMAMGTRSPNPNGADETADYGMLAELR